MKSYRIVVHDTRLGGPVELAAEMRSDARVREYAAQRYGASDHVQAVEVWSGSVRLCAFGQARKAAA
jgi:hypothetical protein